MKIYLNLDLAYVFICKWKSLIFTEKPTIYFTCTQMIFLKSGLLFFSSKCLMRGPVNVVGHVLANCEAWFVPD